MLEMARGQRMKLIDIVPDATRISLSLSLPAGANLDATCFGLDATRKLSDDRYMVFFNQRATPCESIRMTDANRFELDLPRVPDSIQVIVLTLALDGNGTLRSIGGCHVDLSNGSGSARYAFSGADFADERAIMVLELYRKDGQWRVQAVGQGFNGGLDALVRHFGGTVEEAPPPPPKVSLSKITLEKRGEKISLAKDSAGRLGRIECNLNWSAQRSGIDLDLGCFYELANGDRSGVQALGNRFGSYATEPFIELAGDDRTGTSEAGEFLYINGDKIGQIRRICIFAFIYEGVARWSQADGRVTLKVPGHPDVEVLLDNGDDNQTMCGIAMLENTTAGLEVTKLGEYFPGHPELNDRYNWGLRFAAGSKD